MFDPQRTETLPPLPLSTVVQRQLTEKQRAEFARLIARRARDFIDSNLGKIPVSSASAIYRQLSEEFGPSSQWIRNAIPKDIRPTRGDAAQHSGVLAHERSVRARSQLARERRVQAAPPTPKREQQAKAAELRAQLLTDAERANAPRQLVDARGELTDYDEAAEVEERRLDKDSRDVLMSIKSWNIDELRKDVRELIQSLNMARRELIQARRAQESPTSVRTLLDALAEHGLVPKSELFNLVSERDKLREENEALLEELQRYEERYLDARDEANRIRERILGVLCDAPDLPKEIDGHDEGRDQGTE